MSIDKILDAQLNNLKLNQITEPARTRPQCIRRRETGSLAHHSDQFIHKTRALCIYLSDWPIE